MERDSLDYPRETKQQLFRKIMFRERDTTLVLARFLKGNNLELKDNHRMQEATSKGILRSGPNNIFTLNK